MKIVVTGHKGRLGSELIKAGCTPFGADITKRESIETALNKTQPDVIINCAAFTDVDACEEDAYYKQAFAVNTFGVNKLRDEFDGLLIHMSTDYVFNGKRGPYSEGYRKYDPVNDYGLTKIAGEAVLQTHWKKNTVIVRTTGLYGGSSGKQDFFQLLKSYLSDAPPDAVKIEITKKLKGNQTYVPHLVEALMVMADHYNRRYAGHYPKIVNIASEDVISRYEFALKMAFVFDWDVNLIKPVNNIPNWDAKRPTKGGLKTELAVKLGLPIYTISEGLEALKNVV